MQSKKYSAAEFPTDEEINAAAAKSGPGCCGVSYANWARFIAALLGLYAFLALLYWALLEAAIEIRDDDWLELPNRFFGPFSKVERQLTDINGEPVRVEVPDLDFRKDAPHRVNYPDGCTGDADLLTCGKDGSDEEKRLWVIFPWIAESATGGCKDQRYTTLLNAQGELRFGDAGALATGVCVNSAPQQNSTKTGTV